jgi:hypothetical protein
MQNYKIQDNIDFYQELYKQMDEPDNNEIDDSTVQTVCLITNSQLEEDYVALSCKHKFNYDAIYNDIVNHKKKYNSMEKHMIKSNELRCPYCRSVQTQLLPTKEGYKNIHGVNFFDPEQDTVDKSHGYNSDYVHGNCNYEKNCSVTGIHTKCGNKHVKYLPIDGKFYCHLHHHTTLYAVMKANKLKQQEARKLALLEKQKVKEEKQKVKEEKQKEKDEKQKAKDEKQKITEEKQKITEDKQKIKEDKQKVTEENKKIKKEEQKDSQDMSIENVISNEGCMQKLQTGKNKGQYCGAKLQKGKLCIRHYNLLSAKAVHDPSYNTILTIFQCNE